MSVTLKSQLISFQFLELLLCDSCRFYFLLPFPPGPPPQPSQRGPPPPPPEWPGAWLRSEIKRYRSLSY